MAVLVTREVFKVKGMKMNCLYAGTVLVKTGLKYEKRSDFSFQCL